ncbi:hypothetical protein POM88_021056 [Heracleum sosnowskyi]|uniref:Uncharacterized protein n=1 Tax=Heracleum sosnowskyi TaxID=360622 RepID=A0AAD8IE45_9APIA|nr:hypothetical protein POM88_021056 [Heracleum sosnowskyi]
MSVTVLMIILVMMESSEVKEFMEALQAGNDFNIIGLMNVGFNFSLVVVGNVNLCTRLGVDEYCVWESTTCHSNTVLLNINGVQLKSKSCDGLHDDANVRGTSQVISTVGTVRYALQLDVEHRLLEPSYLKIQALEQDDGERIYSILNHKPVHVFEKMQRLAVVKCLVHSASSIVTSYMGDYPKKALSHMGFRFVTEMEKAVPTEHKVDGSDVTVKEESDETVSDVVVEQERNKDTITDKTSGAAAEGSSVEKEGENNVSSVVDKESVITHNRYLKITHLKFGVKYKELMSEEEKKNMDFSWSIIKEAVQILSDGYKEEIKEEWCKAVVLLFAITSEAVRSKGVFGRNVVSDRNDVAQIFAVINAPKLNSPRDKFKKLRRSLSSHHALIGSPPPSMRFSPIMMRTKSYSTFLPGTVAQTKNVLSLTHTLTSPLNFSHNIRFDQSYPDDFTTRN